MFLDILYSSQVQLSFTTPQPAAPPGGLDSRLNAFKFQTQNQADENENIGSRDASLDPRKVDYDENDDEEDSDCEMKILHLPVSDEDPMVIATSPRNNLNQSPVDDPPILRHLPANFPHQLNITSSLISITSNEDNQSEARGASVGQDYMEPGDKASCIYEEMELPTVTARPPKGLPRSNSSPCQWQDADVWHPSARAPCVPPRPSTMKECLSEGHLGAMKSHTLPQLARISGHHATTISRASHSSDDLPSLYLILVPGWHEDLPPDDGLAVSHQHFLGFN